MSCSNSYQMKACLFSLYFLLVSLVQLFAQDTFSIVAVDAATGEVGSAGASCLDNSDITGGVLIISDPHPGRGVIHTQAAWVPANQNNASNQMDLGDSPQEIVDWLQSNDAGTPVNSTIRQYGIADFDSLGNPRAAAYTGVNCMSYKNHIVGPNYSIQGNILLGQQILDSMEARFLNAEGDLGCKLMAALQGANVAGADTRCLAEGVSSQSAFVRVARPGDTLGTLYMDLIVTETPFGMEPIDSVQELFDIFMTPQIPVPNFTYVDSLLEVNFTDASLGASAVAWDFGDGSAGTTQNPFHIYNSAGTYNVCLTAKYKCLSATYCDSITFSATGIDGYTESRRLLVYPNPGNGAFTIESRTSILGAELAVVNAEGQEVMRIQNLKGNLVSLDLTNLPKGVYIVRITTEEDLYTAPLVFE